MLTEEKIREKLHTGDVIKNFKELCILLDEKPVRRSGDSGKALLKQLEQYCTLDFFGQEITVVEMKEQTTLVVDKRKNNSKYAQYVQTLLLKQIYSQNGTMYITPVNLWKKCGMVNKNYKSSDTTAAKLYVQDWELDYFYRTTGKTLYQITMNSIKSLMKAHLIVFTSQVIIVETNGNSFVADEDDIKEIELCKRLALEKLGLYNDKDVILKHKSKEFYRVTQEYLKERRNWKYYYTQFKLRGVRQDLILGAINYNEKMLQLNNNLRNKLESDTTKTVSSQKDKYEAGDSKFKYPSYFETNQKHLVHELINIDETLEAYEEWTMKNPQILDELFDLLG